MTRRLKRFSGTLLAGVLSLIFSLFLFAEEKPCALTILQTTDLHGSPRIARIASAVERERKAAVQRGESILLIDCGDLTSGAFEAQFDEGDAMVKALNLAGCDAWIPGNHDFELGSGVLRRHMNAFCGAVLAANLRLDPPPENPVLPWRMFHCNNLSVAVIGLTSPYLRHWMDPVRLQGVSVASPRGALREVMPEVRKAHPDLIILAVHIGEFSSARLNEDGKASSLADLVRDFPEIVLILGGHSHQTVPGKFLYPGTWFVQAPPHGEGLAKIRILFNRGIRRVTGIESEILDPNSMPGSPEVNTLLQKNLELATAESRRTVAFLPEKLIPVNGGKGAGARILASLLAESMAAASGAELAFSASLNSIPDHPGPLSGRGLFRLLPFDDFISTLDLSPAQVRAILNEQRTLKTFSYRMAVYGLLSKTMPEENGKSGETTEMLVLLPGGKVWSDEQERRCVAFSSYDVCGAGGRYPVLKHIAESGLVNRHDSDLKVRSALEDLLQKKFPPRPLRRPPPEKRAACGPYTAVPETVRPGMKLSAGIRSGQSGDMEK